MAKRKLLTELTRNDLKKIYQHLEFKERIYKDELKGITNSVLVSYDEVLKEDLFYVIFGKDDKNVIVIDGRDVIEINGKIDGFIQGLNFKGENK